MKRLGKSAVLLAAVLMAGALSPNAAQAQPGEPEATTALFAAEVRYLNATIGLELSVEALDYARLSHTAVGETYDANVDNPEFTVGEQQTILTLLDGGLLYIGKAMVHHADMVADLIKASAHLVDARDAFNNDLWGACYYESLYADLDIDAALEDLDGTGKAEDDIDQAQHLIDTAEMSMAAFLMPMP